MAVKLSTELKEAVLNLPVAEKDKLLLKLLAKDEGLCQKLTYELLEEKTTLEERRGEIREAIEYVAQMRHDTPGWLMMAMRDVNGAITRHVKLTKDKYGEVALTLQLLNRVYDQQMLLLAQYTHRSDTAASYIARRTEFILQKLSKLHPDYYVEFEEDVNRLLDRVHSTAPARYAKELQLPARWVY